jgi:hypothetical protein
MPTVRQHVTSALIEIGVLAPGESLSAALGAVGLERFQNQLDSWQADRLSLAVQQRATFPLVSGTSTVTIGTGGSVTTTPTTTTAPMWLDTVAYIIPDSDPEIEVPIGVMDRDTYARLTIKSLSSALPLQCFYQRSNTTALGSLFIWPQVDQNVTMVIYSPQGVGVPATLDSIVIGPPGYAEAFLYELAMRLCRPTGTAVPEGLPDQAAAARRIMQRPNVIPAVLGVDPATTLTTGSGYNVLSDTTQTSR